jgi:membrane protein DedA with SNARE-associated domain
MTDPVKSSSRAERFWGWFRKRIVPLAGLLVVIAIVVAIFYLYWRYPGLLNRLKAYGYLGVFIISVILNATIILPVSNMAVMMTLGTTLPAPVLLGVSLPPPVLVGLIGGFGAGIGEMTGFIAGRSGRDLIARNRMYNRVEGWVKRWGWLAVFILSIVPFVFDLVGIAAGALRMPFWRFFFACWLGRTILYLVMVSAAAYGLKILVPSWFS